MTDDLAKLTRRAEFAKADAIAIDNECDDLKAENQRLREERDAAQQRHVQASANAQGHYEVSGKWKARAEAAESQLTALRAYVQHKPTCEKSSPFTQLLAKDEPIPQICTCGLDQII